ncbi:MAG: peptidyl-prolyl cis-trans isomerase [Cyclonatronaceae bacterium]
MFRLYKAFLLGSLLLAVLLACTPEAPEQQQSQTVIAELDEEQLSLEEALLRIPARQLLADSSAAVQKYRNEWLRQQVLAAEARRQGLAEGETFRLAMQNYERELLAELLIEDFVRRQGRGEIERSEAMRYYEEHREAFVLSERHVRFHHMIAGSMSDATQARKQLLRGAEWDEVAARYSVNTEYSIRNSTLYHPESTALQDFPPMARFLNAIGLTEISPIRQIGDTYHFIRLLEYENEGSVPALDWTLSRIQEAMAVEQRQNQVNAYEQTLLRQAEANRRLRIYDSE